MPATPPWNIARAKARMTALGLNQADVARELGYTKAAVSHWLRGRTVPSPADLHRLAAVLSITAAELVAADDVEVADSDAQREVVRLMKRASDEDQQLVLAIIQAALRVRR